MKQLQFKAKTWLLWHSQLTPCCPPLEKLGTDALDLFLSSSVSIVADQFLSQDWLLATPWNVARQVSLSFAVSQSLLKLLSIESVMPSNHLILCRPLLLLSSISPSIRVFSNESVLRIRWPKNWSFSISPSNEYSGLVSFRIDWFDLLQSKGLSSVSSILGLHWLGALTQRHFATAWISIRTLTTNSSLSAFTLTLSNAGIFISWQEAEPLSFVNCLSWFHSPYTKNLS